jgi:hypothetical protein
VSSWVEILQWVCIAVLAFFLLGAYRLIGVKPTEKQIELTGLSGPGIGAKAPAPLVRAIAAEIGDAPRIVVFVAEGCPACAAALKALATRVDSRSGSVAVVAMRPSAGLQSAVSALGFPMIVDDGQVWSSVGVAATPFALQLDADWMVVDKATGGGRIPLLLEQSALDSTGEVT